jgi:hypothetical protein
VRTHPVRPLWLQLLRLAAGAVAMLVAAALIVLAMVSQLPHGGLR